MAKMAASPGIEPPGIGGKIMSWPQRIKSFYVDVRTEMKKVWTPSRKEVQGTTAVVIITVFLFGFYFWVVDTVLNRSLDAFYRYLTR